MKRLLDAPHRIFFFAAAVQIVLVSAWWAATLAARASGHAGALPDGLAPAAVHAALMIYGFFPLFIFGFLFTAGPRWLDLPAPARADYVAPAILASAGAWMMLPAFLLGPVAAANALLAPIVAWTWLLARFVRMIVASRAPERTHAILAASALGCAVAGLFAARVWLLTGSHSWATVMEAIGIWGFLVPLFAAVSHRMIPFFTANAIAFIPPWRPAWALAVIAGAAYAHGVLTVADLARWTWVVDLPAGVLATCLAWRWGLARSLSNRLLAMLHLGFAWFAAMWLLHALQSMLALAGVAALGLAPMHALSIGFLASLALAMVSRVSCGHSGRTLAADRVTWLAFLVLQAAAATRVAADLFPGAYASLLVAAAILWLACFAAWTWRYLPYYWRARPDGKPG